MIAELKNWLAAVRPRTLPLAVSAALCGCLNACLQGSRRPWVSVLCVVTALCLQIFANLANDYGDALHGADGGKRQGPARMVGSGRIAAAQMKQALKIAAALCCLSGGALLVSALAAAPSAAWLFWTACGAAALAAAYGYTAGRKPYGYAGFGDAAVLVCFGGLAVAGGSVLHTGRLNAADAVLAAAVGLWCVMVLNLNNMRDIRGDLAAGKKTVAARLGLRRAKRYHAALCTAAAVCWWLWLDAVALPAAGVFSILCGVLSAAHLYLLEKAQSCKALDRLLPQWSAAFMLWTALLWAAAV